MCGSLRVCCCHEWYYCIWFNIFICIMGLSKWFYKKEFEVFSFCLVFLVEDFFCIENILHRWWQWFSCKPYDVGRANQVNLEPTYGNFLLAFVLFHLWRNFWQNSTLFLNEKNKDDMSENWINYVLCTVFISFQSIFCYVCSGLWQCQIDLKKYKMCWTEGPDLTQSLFELPSLVLQPLYQNWQNS